MKITIVLFFLFMAYNLHGQWQQLPIDYKDMGYFETVTMQGADTVICTGNRSGGGENYAQAIFCSVDGGKTFTFYFDLYSKAYGRLYYTRFLSNDTMLLITSFGILKKPSLDLPEFIIEFKDVDSTRPEQSPMTCFWDQDSGIVVGSHVFTTFDGGKNWTLTAPFSEKSNGGNEFIYFNANKRFLANREFKIYESFDFGKTWTIIFNKNSMTTDIDKNITSISFFNETEGYCALTKRGFTSLGNTTIYKTIDGGKNWDSVTSHTGVADVKFFDKYTGFAVFEGMTKISTTKDGMKNWDQENTLGEENEKEKFFYFNDSNFYVTNGNRLYKRSGAVLSVHETENNGLITVYPNPVTEILTVSIADKNASLPAEVKLTDINGREIVKKAYTTQEIKIDFTSLKPGTYFLQVQQENRTYTGKILKSE